VPRKTDGDREVKGGRRSIPYGSASPQVALPSLPNADHPSRPIVDLAADFASSVILAIRNASLEEILGETSGAAVRRGSGRPRGSSNKVKAVANGEHTSAPGRKTRGRLQRRSLEEITKALEQVVALVKTKKDGLRAEQIRAELKMDPKELPRVLREGLAKKQLKSEGRKRATVYTVAASP
jgi:hypothetical protein